MMKILSLLFLYFLYCGLDQWTLVPVAIGKDIRFGPPSTSLASSAASGRLARVRVLWRYASARVCSHREFIIIPLPNAMLFASLAHPYHYTGVTFFVLNTKLELVSFCALMSDHSAVEKFDEFKTKLTFKRTTNGTHITVGGLYPKYRTPICIHEF
jgi:hypothetical protein